MNSVLNKFIIDFSFSVYGTYVKNHVYIHNNLLKQKEIEMYASVATKPLSDSNPRNRISVGSHKGTLMAFNIRTYKEENYLQALWALEDDVALTHNFYLNATDPKEKKRANEKLINLLLAVGVTEEVAKQGGFEDYDSLLNKRAYVIVKSFKNAVGEHITYVERYAPITKDSPGASNVASYVEVPATGFVNDEVPW